MRLGLRDCAFILLCAGRLVNLPIAAAQQADTAIDERDGGYIPPHNYVCRRIGSSTEVKNSNSNPAQQPTITIDGLLSELDWTAAPWSDDFGDIQGESQPRPRFRTRVKMLWDERYFYIAAQLEEPHVCATLKQHDSVIFHDNDFELFLDPDGDSHRYGEFEINALGTGWDLRLTKPYKDGGKADDGWEMEGLKSAVSIQGTLNDPCDTDRGWTIELAVPWTAASSLADVNLPVRSARREGSYFECYKLDESYRPDVTAPRSTVSVPPRDGDQWRVNFSRVQWQYEVKGTRYSKVAETREENWVWSPQGIIDMHRPENWGYVQFSSAADAVFRPDAAGSAKHLLHRIYYAQRAYHDKHQRYASALAELNIATARDANVLAGPTIDSAGEASFVATAVVHVGPDNVQRWHIREDALIWRDESSQPQQ